MQDLPILISSLTNGENYTIDGVTTMRPPTRLTLQAARALAKYSDSQERLNFALNQAYKDIAELMNELDRYKGALNALNTEIPNPATFNTLVDSNK